MSAKDTLRRVEITSDSRRASKPAKAPVPASTQASLSEVARVADTDGERLSPRDIKRLQHAIGNRATAHLLQSKPSANTIQRKLVLDGKDITDATQIPRYKKPDDDYKVSHFRTWLFNHPDTFKLTTDEIQTYYDLCLTKAKVPDKPASEAERAYRAVLETYDTKAFLERSSGGAYSFNRFFGGKPENLREMSQFFAANPQFMEFIRKRGLKFNFVGDTPALSGYGGAAFKDNTVIIGSEVASRSPEQFMRNLVHETGHGTFQQLLMNAKISNETDKGVLAGALQQFSALQVEIQQKSLGGAGERGGKELDQKEVAEAVQREKEFDRLTQVIKDAQAKLVEDKQKFTADGQVFYQAWETLRKNNGQYLLGVDLGGAGTPVSRLKYQADTFGEFCAESFMHIAREEPALTQHITAVQRDEKAPPEVKDAWNKVMVILLKYRDIIMRGQNLGQ